MRLFLWVFLIVVDGRLKGLVQILCEWPGTWLGDVSLWSWHGALSARKGLSCETGFNCKGDTEYSVVEAACWFRTWASNWRRYLFMIKVHLVSKCHHQRNISDNTLLRNYDFINSFCELAMDWSTQAVSARLIAGTFDLTLTAGNASVKLSAKVCNERPDICIRICRSPFLSSRWWCIHVSSHALTRWLGVWGFANWYLELPRTSTWTEGSVSFWNQRIIGGKSWLSGSGAGLQWLSTKPRYAKLACLPYLWGSLVCKWSLPSKINWLIR